MNNLGLPHPKLLEIAIPANLKCGEPDEDSIHRETSWGPITVTFAGIPEVEPDWVARHLDEVTVLDVRTESEYVGDLGHIDGSILIPLDQLRDRISEIKSDRPIVTVCQSGKRSEPKRRCSPRNRSAPFLVRSSIKKSPAFRFL